MLEQAYAPVQDEPDAEEDAEEQDDHAYTAPAAVPVAASYASAGSAGASSVETWSVTMLDAKKKKKKGTLGVGNGSLFFASESDKVRPDASADTSPQARFRSVVKTSQADWCTVDHAHTDPGPAILSRVAC